VAESDPYRRSLIVADAVEWLAAQTHAKVDDQLVSKLAAVLKTPAGEDLVRWVMSQVEAVR
jgi:HD-GYP domain-containing protein (c-di-GMP phosphodiesterase class II)